MKSAWILILFLFTVSFGFARAQEQEEEIDRALIERAVLAVVKIDVVYGPNNDRESGSGVLVAPTGVIFTNRHVVGQSDISSITISILTDLASPPEPLFGARTVFISEDEDFDFAILQINESVDALGLSLPVNPTSLDLPYMEQWATLELRPGDPVLVAGFRRTGGETLFFGDGEVTSISREGDVTTAQADLAVTDGISGGLIFNRQGEMVGLAFEKLGAEAGDLIAPILTVQSICEQVPDECDRYRPNVIAENPVCQLERAAEYCANTPFTIGMTAQIGSLESQFQLRGDYFWEAQWIKPLARGSFVTIIGGPQLSLDDVLTGFELFWWQVEDSEGSRGWVVESFFGEPVLIPARMDEPVIFSSVCQLLTLYPVAIRSGPGDEYEQTASRRFEQAIAADGQITGTDGLVWWRLLDGFWINEYLVREDDTCFTLPVVSFP